MHPGFSSSAYIEQCSCGRTFLSPAAFKNHQNSCLENKQRLSAILAKAKSRLSANQSVRTKRILDIGREPTCPLPAESALQAQPDIDNNVGKRIHPGHAMCLI